jgi:hypothetical protein
LAISQIVNPNPVTGVPVGTELVHSSYGKATQNKILTKDRFPAAIPPGTYAVVGTRTRGVNNVLVTFRDADDETVYGFNTVPLNNLLTQVPSNVNMVQLMVVDKEVTSVTYNYSWTGWVDRTQAFSVTATGGSINGLGYGNGIYVSVGQNSGQFSIQTSSDSITWTVRINSATTTEARAVAYGNYRGNKTWVVVGSGGIIFSSTDSNTWIQRTSPTANILNAASFGNSTFVAAGAAGTLISSTDGFTWVSRVSGFGVTPINALVFGNGVHVAAGDGGRLSTSTDGINWTTRTSGFGGVTSIRSLAFGNGLFLAGGDAGVLTTSTDGINWTTRQANIGTNVIRSIAWGDGLYVMGSDSGIIRVSTDGYEWQIRSAVMTSSQIRAITYGNGIGIFGTPVNGVIPSTPTPYPQLSPTNNLPGGMFLLAGGNTNTGSRLASSEQGFEATVQVYKI